MAERAIETGTVKTNALRLSLAAIISVFIFEFSAGIYTNSLALLTDGIHALLDAVVTAVLIIAVTLALKPRDIDHTYGHGKIETIGGFIGGVALFVIAIFFIYEAFFRIAILGTSLSIVNPGVIGFAAVLYTLAADGFRIAVLRRAMKKSGLAKGIAGSSVLKADFYHAFADMASTTVAFIGLWLVTAGFSHGDSVAAIVLGIFLAYLSSRFAYQNAIELTDVISPKQVARVRQAVNGTDGVLECQDIKMRRVGREVFVEVTIALRANMSFENAHEVSAQVERNIASSLASEAVADFKVTPKNIIVHFEPIWSADTPMQSLIEKAATAVSGVKGVHNILVSKIGTTNMMEVSLHVQVDRSATLAQAHLVADRVEDSIKERLKGVEQITVHLEPLIPDVGGLEPLSDKKLEDTVKAIVLSQHDVKETGKIVIYKTAENFLKIDVSCIFKSEDTMTIEQIHERVSEIEDHIRSKYPDALVTIHAEPA